MNREVHDAKNRSVNKSQSYWPSQASSCRRKHSFVHSYKVVPRYPVAARRSS